MSKLVEKWRDIEGYEGLYQVSDWGRVKNKHEKIIKPQKSNNGYLRVNLWKNSVYSRKSIHRLVYETYIGKIPNGLQINHIDEDKTNNSIENLNLMSPKENSNWGTRNERNSKSQLNDKEKSRPINVYDFNTNRLLYTFPSIAEAKRKIGVNNVSKVINGTYKQEKGYTFGYA